MPMASEKFRSDDRKVAVAHLADTGHSMIERLKSGPGGTYGGYHDLATHLTAEERELQKKGG